MTVPDTNPRYRCVDLHDVYIKGDQAAVYAGDQVAVLSPVATMLLLLIRDGVTRLGELAVAAEERFGAPAGGRVAAVSQQLDDLVRGGLVRSDICDSDDGDKQGGNAL